MSLSDFLTQTGGKSFKFDHIGASISGKVVSAEVVQKRNFDTGEPEFWSDGKPVEQVRVVVETTERDPSDPEDDGNRSIYIKGWGDQKRELIRAVRAAGMSDIEAGSTFTATYVADGELPPGKRGFAPKIYKYELKAGTSTSAMFTEQPAASTVLMGEQPAPAPAPQVPAADPSLEERKAKMRAAGLTDDQIAAALSA